MEHKSLGVREERRALFLRVLPWKREGERSELSVLFLVFAREWGMGTGEKTHEGYAMLFDPSVSQSRRLVEPNGQAAQTVKSHMPPLQLQKPGPTGLTHKGARNKASGTVPPRKKNATASK